jgi:hypothetical protein
MKRAEKRRTTWKITRTELKNQEEMFGVVPKSPADFEKNFSHLEYIRSIFFPDPGPMKKTIETLTKRRL